MRLTSAGEITFPHFGHTASSDASTFSRLIFRELGIAGAILVCTSDCAFAQGLLLAVLVAFMGLHAFTLFTIPATD